MRSCGDGGLWRPLALSFGAPGGDGGGVYWVGTSEYTAFKGAPQVFSVVERQKMDPQSRKQNFKSNWHKKKRRTTASLNSAGKQRVQVSNLFSHSESKMALLFTISISILKMT